MGIYFRPNGPSSAVISDVYVSENYLGIVIDGINASSGDNISAVIKDTIADHNSTGFFATGSGGIVKPNLFITNSSATNNTSIGIASAFANISISNTKIAENTPYGFNISGGGSIKSYGNNNIVDTTNVGALTSVSLQ